MEIKEENKTRKWIIDALFALLKTTRLSGYNNQSNCQSGGSWQKNLYRYFKSKDEVMEYTTKLDE